MIFLKKPDDEDVKFIHMLWNDEATMEAVGGSTNMSFNDVKEWYNDMNSTSLKTGLYTLIIDGKKPVGEVSFRGFDEEAREAWFNIKVLSTYRNKGYAVQAAQLILKEFFITFNGSRMLDNLSITNIQGQKFLEKLGFCVIRKTDEEIVYSLEKNTFLNKLNNY